MIDSSTTHCDTLQASFSDKLDNGSALSAEETQHLAQCRDCAEFYHFISSGIFTSIATSPASRGSNLTDSIMARLDTATQQREDLPKSQQASWKKIIAFSTLSAAAAIAISISINPESTPKINTTTASTTTTPLSDSEAQALERITSLPAQLISPDKLEQQFSNISQAAAEKWTTVSTKISDIKSTIKEQACHLSDKFLAPDSPLPQSSITESPSKVG